MRLVSLLLLLVSAAAQGQEMIWSTPQKITNHTFYTNILGENHSGIYYFQTSKNERDRHILITALRQDMKLRTRKEFLQNKSESMEKLVLFDNWIALIYSVRERNSGEVLLKAKMLDPDLNQISEDKLILTKKTDDHRTDFFKVYPARDRKSLLITVAKTSDSMYNNLEMLVLDNNCKVLKKDLLTIDFEQDFELARHRFVNNEYFCVLSYTQKDGLLKREKFKILLEKDLTTGKTYLHKLYGDNFITNHGLFSFDNKTKSFNFTSFYYEEDTTKPIGFFQYQIFTQQDSAKQRQLAFHPVFMNEIFGRARNNNDMKTLYLMKTVKRTDGGDIFICERREIDEQQLDDVSMYGVQQTYVRYYYYYYEISVLSINPDGSLDWHKVIKKEQISLNDEGYYSSFGCQVTDDRLYFIYNDLSRKSSNVLIYEVNPDGQGEGDIFIRGSELDGYAIPKESIQISSSEFLVPLIKLREGFTLLKIRS
ncbi:hypothetical protein GC194_14085 [bacterium]|nr:hypothetical protein [bacterium]